jgi:hypothetical protein
VVEATAKKPLAPVTVTMYVPVVSVVMLYIPPDMAISVPAGLPLEGPLQLTWYPGVPAEAVTAILPLLPPEQVTLVGTRLIVGTGQLTPELPGTLTLSTVMDSTLKFPQT